MSRVAALAAVLVVLGGCDAAARAETPDADIKRIEIERMRFGEGVTVIHDDARAVTCWVYDGYSAGGISCIPDWQLAHDGDGLVVMPEADQ